VLFGRENCGGYISVRRSASPRRLTEADPLDTGPIAALTCSVLLSSFAATYTPLG
jgi:hypothetical protein